MSRRVVVTGRGVVSPLAPELGGHLAAVWAGQAAARPTPASLPFAASCPWIAEVQGFDRRRAIRTRMLRKLLTRSAAYAVAAAGAALEEAGLVGDEATLRDAGLYAGSVCIDFDPEIFIPALRESIGADGELDIHRFAARGLHLIDPLFLVKTLPNGGIGGIAIEHQVTGPSLNITNGTVSGLQALISAVDAIRRGDAEVMVAGGCDSLLSMDSIAEHVVTGRLATAAAPPVCRPFDRHRSGYVLGEAAVFLVLEDAERARARQAPVFGELLGGGQTGSCRTAEAEPLADAGHRAFDAAGLQPADIGVLFGDGVAVAEDDRMEEAAARRLFVDRPPPYSAAIGAVGFTGAASGPLSVLHALGAFECGKLPPLVGCQTPDPECRLDLVLTPRPAARSPVLVWNSDRGLKNAALVIGPPP